MTLIADLIIFNGIFTMFTVFNDTFTIFTVFNCKFTVIYCRFTLFSFFDITIERK